MVVLWYKIFILETLYFLSFHISFLDICSKMKNRWTFLLVALGVLFSESFTRVQSQGIMGGFKGHHRGAGAVEFLLATGILAKLLNFRNKHGANMGRHLLHALIGPRYPTSHLRWVGNESQYYV